MLLKNKKSRKKGRGAHYPFDPNGELNEMWIRENDPYSHSTLIVDSKGTGTYCHVTFTPPNDDGTRYHYGFETRKSANRDKGLMFWTTPYRDEDKLTNEKKRILMRVYDKLCRSLERDSSHYSRSRSRSPRRDSQRYSRSRDVRRDSRDSQRYSRDVRRDSRGGSLKRKFTCKYRKLYKK